MKYKLFRFRFKNCSEEYELRAGRTFVKLYECPYVRSKNYSSGSGLWWVRKIFQNYSHFWKWTIRIVQGIVKPDLVLGPMFMNSWGWYLRIYFNVQVSFVYFEFKLIFSTVPCRINKVHQNKDQTSIVLSQLCMKYVIQMNIQRSGNTFFLCIK